MEKINRTVKRALDIMQLLKDAQRPMTSKEISVAMEIPVTSAFDIIRTLYREGYLEYANEGSKAYVIGSKAYEIGSAYMKSSRIVEITTPYCEKLMQMSGATSFFAAVHGDYIIYMNKVEAPTSIRTSAELGSRKNLNSSGLGKAVMACYTEDHIRKIFENRKPVSITNFTITDADTMIEEMKRTRERGYSIDDREDNTNIFCIACAIRDYTGKPIGAISVAMVYDSINDRIVREYGAVVARYALEISRKMGFIGSSIYADLPPY